MKILFRILALILGAALIPAAAQTGSRYNVPFTTAFDTTGVVSPGAQMFFYQTGTSTPANTYSNVGLSTPNSNPVVANGAGLFGNIFLTPGQSYKVVLEDANNNTIWTADPVFSNSGGTFQVVANYTALAALTSATANQAVYVQGANSVNDGGQGIFYWNSSSTATADGGTIIQATGISTGRFIRQLPQTPTSINVQMFGAKCDGSTNDYTAMQNAENYAAANHVVEYYPAGQCNFGSTITLGIGVIHRGAGMGNTTLNYTGTTGAMKLQLPNGTAIIQAPQFFDFTLQASALTGTNIALQLNSIAGGFTNDASTQEFMFQPIIQRVLFQGPSSAGIAFQCSKCFDLSFTNSNVQYFATAVDVEGSDAPTISDNAMYYASAQEILAVFRSTFGSELKIAHNDMPDILTGATAFINSSYHSAWIEHNHIEEDSGTVTALVSVTGAGQAPLLTMNDNQISATSAVTSCWLKVTGAFQLISATNNNENAGPSQPGVCFNSSSGAASNALYYYNSSYRQIIYGRGNLNGDFGFPFVSIPGSINVPAAYITATGIGSVIWDFTPNLSGLNTSNAGTSIFAANNAWTLPPSSNSAVSQGDWQGIGTLPAGVDVWVCGYGDTNGQTITALDGVTSPTQALTTTNACYRMFSNVTFGSATISVKNADTVTNSNAHITEIKVLVH